MNLPTLIQHSHMDRPNRLHPRTSFLLMLPGIKRYNSINALQLNNLEVNLYYVLGLNNEEFNLSIFLQNSFRCPGCKYPLILQVLRFYAYFKQTVHESPAEFYRVRPVVIYYYLEDDSIAVVEPVRENSGMPQGTASRHSTVYCSTQYERSGFSAEMVQMWTVQWGIIKGFDSPFENVFVI